MIKREYTIPKAKKASVNNDKIKNGEVERSSAESQDLNSHPWSAVRRRYHCGGVEKKHLSLWINKRKCV